jgi:hypothetical protein
MSISPDEIFNHKRKGITNSSVANGVVGSIEYDHIFKACARICVGDKSLVVYLRAQRSGNSS